jgi:hypothetical protein
MRGEDKIYTPLMTHFPFPEMITNTPIRNEKRVAIGIPHIG